MSRCLRFPAASVLVLVGLLSAFVLPAGATTGTTPLAHPPRFGVTKSQAVPFLGHFKLVKRPKSRLISGAYVAWYNDNGYVEGGLAVYTYGPGGREISWVGRTYEYHQTNRGMTIDVISAANEQIFARLRLRAGRHGRLTGWLRELLPVPRRPTPIILRPVGP
jgi:hypothetical protein